MGMVRSIIVGLFSGRVQDIIHMFFTGFIFYVLGIFQTPYTLKTEVLNPTLYVLSLSSHLEVLNLTLSSVELNSFHVELAEST
jgi:hypothetical protein